MRNRLFKGVFASYYGQVITIVFQLLSVPVFLQYWGVDKYASWIVIYTIPSIIGMMELGIFNVVINEVSLLKKIDSNAAYKLASTVNSFLIIIFLLSCFVTLLFHSNPYVIIMGYSLLLILNNYYNALFKLTSEYHIGCFIANTIRLCEYGTILTMVYLKCEIIHVFMVLFLLRFLSTVVVYSISIKSRNYCGLVRYKDFNFNSCVDIKDILKNSLLSLSVIANNQVLVILIKYYFGEIYVIMFSTMRTFFRFSNQITSAINNTIWQEFITLFRSGNFNKLNNILIKVFKINLLILLMFFLSYLFVGHYVYDYWIKGEVKYTYYQYTILLCSVIFYSLWQPLYIYLNTIKKYSYYSMLYFLLQLALFFTITILSYNNFIFVLAFSELIMVSYLFFIVFIKGIICER